MTNVKYFKKFFLKILLELFLTIMFANGHIQKPQQPPIFLAPLENITVTQGRDVCFTCIVNHIGEYKVAWIKSDTKAILAIHVQMIALNSRLSVTHNGHNTYKLHIAHVQLNDSGSYMCQVNTDPMTFQSGYLDVVVPPDILNEPDSMNSANSEEGITNEGGQIQLICTATGVPAPHVQWRREDSKDIVLRHDGRTEKQLVKHVDGEKLILHQVHRTDMGGYLCIATNGIPPTVSKRFDVRINFAPSVKPVNQLVAAPINTHVTLQCITEVFPKPLTEWFLNSSSSYGKLLHDKSKYIMSEGMINAYTWQMNLTIKNLKKDDFGIYRCLSINALGKQDGIIHLQELRLPPKLTTTTTSQPFIYTTAKVRRKQHQSHNNKGAHDTSRVKETFIPNLIHDNEIFGSIEVQTQIPPYRNGNGIGGNGVGGNNGNNNGNGIGNGVVGGNGIIEKTRNTQMPASVPSQRPPWILNCVKSKYYLTKGNIIVLLFLCVILILWL